MQIHATHKRAVCQRRIRNQPPFQIIRGGDEESSSANQSIEKSGRASGSSQGND
jgi:hypothetical protein